MRLFFPTGEISVCPISGDDLLFTFRSYVTPSVFLEKLFSHYDSTEEQKFLRTKLANLIKHWLAKYFHDFDSDIELKNNLRQKILNSIHKADSNLGNRLLTSLDKKRELKYVMKEISLVTKDQLFENWETNDVAQQLSLYQQHLYRSIHPKEFLRQAWMKKQANAPNIIAISEHANTFSGWVQTQILTRQGKDQKEMFFKFVKIAIACYTFNNFLGVFTCVQSLRTSPIHRLTYLWEELQKKKKIYGSWKLIEDMVVGDSSMKDYRTNIRTATPPVVPFLAVLLKDLVYLEDGNPDYLNVGRKDIVNITKMALLSKQIDSLVMYQHDVYPFAKDEIIYDYFSKGLQFLSEDEVWKLSYVHVPRGKANV